eukprot:2836617-Rhodomonas_salina.1
MHQNSAQNCTKNAPRTAPSPATRALHWTCCPACTQTPPKTAPKPQKRVQNGTCWSRLRRMPSGPQRPRYFPGLHVMKSCACALRAAFSSPCLVTSHPKIRSRPALTRTRPHRIRSRPTQPRSRPPAKVTSREMSIGRECRSIERECRSIERECRSIGRALVPPAWVGPTERDVLLDGTWQRRNQIPHLVLNSTTTMSVRLRIVSVQFVPEMRFLALDCGSRYKRVRSTKGSSTQSSAVAR